MPHYYNRNAAKAARDGLIDAMIARPGQLKLIGVYEEGAGYNVMLKTPDTPFVIGQTYGVRKCSYSGYQDQNLSAGNLVADIDGDTGAPCIKLNAEFTGGAPVTNPQSNEIRWIVLCNEENDAIFPWHVWEADPAWWDSFGNLSKPLWLEITNGPLASFY